MRAPELRAAAIEWLSAVNPVSIIVPELSVADWGGASIDVAAVTPTHIVGIEIKGEGDSPARLPLQGCLYGRVARFMWLLPDRGLQARCLNHLPRLWGVLECGEDGVRPRQRFIAPTHARVREHRAREMRDQTSAHLCGALWRDELHALATDAGLQPAKRAPVMALTRLICDSLPVTEIHDKMIQQLWTRDWSRYRDNVVRVGEAALFP